MKKLLTLIVFITIVLAVSFAAYAQIPTIEKEKMPMTIGEALCSKYKFKTPKDYRDCVKKKDEPYTLPDLKVHGLSVSAGRYDASGFVKWSFTVQVENTGGTKGLTSGPMPVFTDIQFGRICPQHEYCPENYERLMEEHRIAIPKPGELITLSFEHEFYDPDGSGTIPKNFFILIDSRYGGVDSVPGAVIESNEYNNVGYIDFTYVEKGNNYWYRVY